MVCSSHELGLVRKEKVKKALAIVRFLVGGKYNEGQCGTTLELA